MDLSNNIGIYSAYGVYSGKKENSSLASSLRTGQVPHSYDTALSSPIAQLNETENNQLRELKDSLHLLKGADKVTLISVLTAKNALAQSKELLQNLNCAICVGSSRGPTELIERSLHTFFNEHRVPTPTSPLTTMGNLSSTVAQALAVTVTHTATVSATCTSGMAALIHSIALIKSGMAEGAIAIGAEAPLTPFTASQMNALGVLVKGDPKPFPTQPLGTNPQSGSGLTLGEGGAAFVLAPIERSTKEIRPIAVITGVGSATEKLSSLTGVSEDGALLSRSMKLALDAAGSPPIDLVLMHAPGTKKGDAAELSAVTSCFPSSLPPLYSPKWFLGHTFGASGPLSLLLATELLNGKDLAPPPYESYGAENLPLLSPPKNILINTAGFGGVASSLVVSAFHS